MSGSILQEVLEGQYVLIHYLVVDLPLHGVVSLQVRGAQPVRFVHVVKR